MSVKGPRKRKTSIHIAIASRDSVYIRAEFLKVLKERDEAIFNDCINSACSSLLSLNGPRTEKGTKSLCVPMNQSLRGAINNLAIPVTLRAYLGRFFIRRRGRIRC